MRKRKFQKLKAENGYSLLELVITLTVLSILIMGTIPLSQNAVKRQKEIRLRETLRQIRSAIDEFKRDTVGACPQGAASTTNPIPGQTGQSATANNVFDPRSRVVIDDCKIFETENLDRYPPTLETLVDGVKVKQRGINLGSGRVFDDKNATDINENKEVIKKYLRELPKDPMTGESDWVLRSSYQEKGSDNWDEVNVFDVHSASEEEALNGEKYSDW
ncbi:MAG TPA: type II secretion system protein [Pyrinomonadaceae bacterium]|nr:type II secretion system protein [Pyrinomonadaceae bacterium]